MSIAFDNLVLRHGGFTLSADFEISEGHKVALIGPSGGGKSTLLSCLAGFKEPEQGAILFKGHDITDLHPAKRPVTLLFQDHNLFPHLSAFQNVALGLKANLKLSGDEKNSVKSALNDVGLSAVATRLPAELSGGQQQRVALARALLRDRPILALDEPFAALGPALKHEMLDLVDQITTATQATVLMVTHQPEDAAYLADQTVLIAEGVAHSPVQTGELFANPPAALREYLGN